MLRKDFLYSFQLYDNLIITYKIWSKINIQFHITHIYGKLFLTLIRNILLLQHMFKPFLIYRFCKALA